MPRRDCPGAGLVARWQSRVTGSSNHCTSIIDVTPSRRLSLSADVNVSSAAEYFLVFKLFPGKRMRLLFGSVLTSFAARFVHGDTESCVAVESIITIIVMISSD